MSMTHPAVVAAARGLAVFPLPPGGRHAPPGWQAAATRTPDLAAWPPGANIGVGCRASRVVVLDLDRHGRADGVANFAYLAISRRGVYPTTFTVVTPSGGCHLYFRAPAGVIVGSGSAMLGPGIDVRGPGRAHGGYVVGPGSTVRGVSYQVSNGSSIAELPDWLVPLLEAATRRPQASRP